MFIPDIGVPPAYDGAWAGVFDHKNHLGPAMILEMISLACIADRFTGVNRVRTYALFFVCFILLVGSRNGAGAGIAIMLATVIPFLLWCRAKRIGKLAFLGAVGLLSIVVVVLMLPVGVERCARTFR